MTTTSPVLDRQRLVAAAAPARRASELPVLIVIAAHVPLALGMSRIPLLSTVHALSIFLIGAIWAWSRRPFRVLCVGAYLTGAEVLWRMTGASTPWEFAKYATAAIFLIALFRAGKRSPPILMGLYFLFLLPSAVLTVAHAGAMDARSEISYNLSGPLALMVCAWFGSTLRLARSDLTRVATWLIAPIVGIAAIAAYGTASAQDLTFGTGSNFQTSGGYGPNQVSAILGLGAVAAVSLLIHGLGSRPFRSVLFLIALGLGAQSALTFSRTGVAIAVFCLAAGSIPLMTNPRALLGVGVVFVVLAAATFLVVLPRLDAITEGALVERFENKSLTHRDELAMIDLRIFAEHPLLGVGPGEARALRSEMGRGGLAHTEYTRMLAEHGLFGLLSLSLLLLAAFECLRKASTSWTRSIVLILLVWAFLFMAVSGVRLVAPAFVFGLASVAFVNRRAGSSRKAAPAPPPSRRQTTAPLRPLASPATRWEI